MIHKYLRQEVEDKANTAKKSLEEGKELTPSQFKDLLLETLMDEEFNEQCNT